MNHVKLFRIERGPMKVIKLFEDKKEYSFKKAYASQSRLMGVIGIRMHFEDVILFFHLDFEEYGLDRFEVYAGEEGSVIERITNSFVGGLGEDLIEISYDQACLFIDQAIDIGNQYDNEAPIDYYEFEDRIENFDSQVEETCICKELRSDEELIHYFFMRVAGCDYDVLPYLSEVNYKLYDHPTVLLKNEIVREENYYIVKSYIDYENAYRLNVSKVFVDGKIVNCQLIETLDITAREASFQLNKKEYITILFNESSMFEYNLVNGYSGLLRNVYDAGNLYTIFSQNNDHVNQAVYYLNGDVDSIVYVTNYHIVLSSFDEDRLERTKEVLLGYGLEVVVDLEAEHPLIYSFVNSGLEDFFDFLGE